MMTFRHVDPSIWRWVGLALMTGRIPAEGRNAARMAVLRNLIEIGPDATDEDIELELEQFRISGKRRV